MSSSHRPSAPVLLAPGASSSALTAYAPGRYDARPAVDDRLVQPESHAQIVHDQVIRTMRAQEPHAAEHTEVAHVFRGCLAEGYGAAVDMLTRTSDDTDVAPDVSVYPRGRDPVTGGRRLEEITFEVIDSERFSHATAKVEALAERGVRRLFCVRVTDRTVFEWSREVNDWQVLAEDSEITDRCFTVPIPVKALVDRFMADDTVAQALLVARNRVIEEALDQRALKAKLEAKRDSLRLVMETRGFVVEHDQHARISGCDDGKQLDAWLRRAVGARNVDDALG